MRVFLLGATPSFDQAQHVTPEQRLAATGHNSGNQIIAAGLLNLIDFSALSWDHAKGPEYVNANYDMIVIAAANFLHAGFDFGGMAAFIERTSLPVVMVGVGAQAPDAESIAIDLPAGTVRLMKVVSERSHTIGVRGDFTARVLRGIGIDNVQVVGCPSYYMNGAAGFALRNDPFDAQSPIAVHASRDVIRHSYSPPAMRAAVARLYAEAMRRKGAFIAQTEREEIAIAEGQDVAVNAARLAAELRLLGVGDPDESWLSSGMRVFWDVAPWIYALRGYSLCVGTRIHGTIAALHAGTPAVCITHDSRTLEMCQFLGIPYIQVQDFDGIELQRLRSIIDERKINKNYHDLFKKYINFLENNGVKAIPSVIHGCLADIARIDEYINK